MLSISNLNLHYIHLIYLLNLLRVYAIYIMASNMYLIQPTIIYLILLYIYRQQILSLLFVSASRSAYLT
jgi:hypothetical protein